MVRLRTLVRAIAAASVLTSGMAHGLGLGEITLKSALNQPLDAEIELLEVRDLGSGEVIPSLASPEEFSKAGVDRLYYLTDLKFTPVVKPNGKSVIRVTSSKPVQEPYLNFLVQVLWPNGRLLREYTVLLDPPLYSPQAAASAPQAPVSAPRATGAPRAPQAPAPVRTTAPAGSDTYRTVSNDTLWEIAQRNRTDRVSVPQAMLAFQELNPGAFVDGNINRLKSGQVLRIPTEQQMLERSPREALSQVQAQNQSWRGSRNPAAGSAGARQLDATQRNAQKEKEEAQAFAADAGEEQEDALDLGKDGFDDLTLDEPEPQVAAVAPQVEKTTAQTSDALGEADIYIAYGRFNQAAELLQNAIYDEPQRTDLRLKLMEVYAEMGDREGFARQENELREIGGAQPQVEQLKSRYPAMVAVAAVAGLAGAKLAQDELDSFSLDDLSLDDSGHAAKPDAAGQDLDDAFDLSLDDLGGDDVQADLKSDSGALDDLTLDSDLDLAASTPADKPVDDLDFGLDFAELAETPSQPKHDDLGDFSLDLDAPEDKLSDDDFLLSLNDEVPAAAPADNEFTLDTEAAEEPALSLPDDFDLSLADEPTEPAAPERGEDSFAAQLDEVSAQLDELASNLDEPKSATPSFSAEDAAVASALDGDADDDFDFLSGADEAATKLDLARAYIDMGDSEGARDILDEVLAEGNDSQQAEARELLERLA
ncbi:TPA: FimV family protein [Pseudomonas aeruginosa]|nr:FimV family protein [Pseudomonas aeruginosa]